MEEHKAYYFSNQDSLRRFMDQIREEGFGIIVGREEYEILGRTPSAPVSGVIFGKRALILERNPEKFDESISKLQKLAEEFKG